MQMVYNSDSYVVVQFDAQSASPEIPGAQGPATVAEHVEPPFGPGGFEIVDKQGRADVFLHGAVAEHFQRGAQALMQQLQQLQEAQQARQAQQTHPSRAAEQTERNEAELDLQVLDDYIAGFMTLGRQPLAMH
jgi:hypothetical protein